LEDWKIGRLFLSPIITLQRNYRGKELKAIYDSLNPAELKRKIDQKLKMLYKAYQKKKSLPVETSSIIRKKLMPSMVSFYASPSNPLRCHD